MDIESIFKTKSNARARYQQFVLEGVVRTSPWNQLKGQVLLGSEAFVDTLRPYSSEVEKWDEILRAQRLVDRPALADLLANKEALPRKIRDEKICQAHLEFGYSMSSIGRLLDLHNSTVSRIMRAER